MEIEGATKPLPKTYPLQHGGTMTRLKKLLRRLDAYTLETYNPPHARWHTKR